MSLSHSLVNIMCVSSLHTNFSMSSLTSTHFNQETLHHLFDLKVKSKISVVVHSVIPVLRRLRQEDCEFDASLDYKVRP
jgi:hypothetical protein